MNNDNQKPYPLLYPAVTLSSHSSTKQHLNRRMFEETTSFFIMSLHDPILNMYIKQLMIDWESGLGICMTIDTTYQNHRKIALEFIDALKGKYSIAHAKLHMEFIKILIIIHRYCTPTAEDNKREKVLENQTLTRLPDCLSYSRNI